VSDPEWQHWPSMNLFALLSTGEIVKNVTYGLYAVHPAEGEFLSIMHAVRQEQANVQAKILETRDGHVAGLATLAPERRWGRPATTYVFDLCVHPNGAEKVPELIEEFTWPQAHVLAYAAETGHLTIDLLAESDFHPHSHIERFFDGQVGLVIMDRD